jgi:hypothetical protein
MKVSFAGTHRGMSAWQKQQLEEFFQKNKNRIVTFSHGCCIGACLEAHAIARKVCGQSLFIAAYPSTAKTRGTAPPDTSYEAEPKPPLERDEDIIDQGNDLLIAAPLEMSKNLRSGTWHAVMYAERKKVKVLILWRE